MKIRILLAGVAAVVAMAFSASSALAVTVSPSGTHTATSIGPVTLQVGNGWRANCEKSSFAIVVSSEGTVKGSGVPTFTNCSSTLGPASIYSYLNRPFQPEFSFGASGLNLKLVNFGLHAVSNGGTCTFDTAGYEATTIPGVSPLSFSEFGFTIPRELSTATMKLSNFETAEGQKHCLSVVSVGQPAALGAKYQFVPPLTVTK